MPISLMYSENIPIPKGDDIIIFRNKRDGQKYYKKWNDSIVKLDKDGDIYFIHEKKIGNITNITGEDAQGFYTDKGFGLIFSNATHSSKTVYVSSGGGGGNSSSNNGGSLQEGYIYIGNSNNKAVGVEMSGDITISNNGVTEIGDGKVDYDTLDDEIQLAIITSFMYLTNN